MSVEKLNIKDMPVSEKMSASDLDPLKLSLISYGSLCGLGLGLFLSFLITSVVWKSVFAALLFYMGLNSVLKRLELLRK